MIENYIEEHALTGWTITQNSKNLGWRLNFRQLLIDVLDYDVDYVFFSDQDDSWYLDKNEKQVKMMLEHPEIDVLSADVDIKLMSEKATKPNIFQFSSEELLSQYPIDFSYHNYRQGWTFCMRKTFISRVMPHYKSGLVLSHDNLMTGISGVLKSGFNLNEPVGLHKRHGGNASGNLLTIHSSFKRHLSELMLVVSYYRILVGVLQDQQNEGMEEAKKYLLFNEQRYTNAKNHRWGKTVHQMLFQGKYYDSFTNRVRDLLFLFKSNK